MRREEHKTIVVGVKYICEILKKEFAKEDLAFEVHNYTICREGLSLLPDFVKNDKELMYIVTSWFAHREKISFDTVNLSKGWWIITRNMSSRSFQEIKNVTGGYPSENRKKAAFPLESLADCVAEVLTFSSGWESWILHDGILVKYFQNKSDLTYTKTFDAIRTDDDLLPISYLSKAEDKGTLVYYLSTFKEDWGPFKSGEEIGIIRLNFRTGEWGSVKKIHLSNGQLTLEGEGGMTGKLRINFEG